MCGGAGGGSSAGLSFVSGFFCFVFETRSHYGTLDDPELAPKIKTGLQLTGFSFICLSGLRSQVWANMPNFDYGWFSVKVLNMFKMGSKATMLAATFQFSISNSLGCSAIESSSLSP